jgi:hypothetical protein
MVFGPNFLFLHVGTFTLAKPDDGTRFRTKHAIKMVSPHHDLDKPEQSNMTLTKSVSVLFFYSATPFDSGE